MVEASDALQAIEHLYDERPFDLVLCDVRLPDGHGTDVSVRANRIRPAPVVIAMSGAATAEEGWHLAAAGARAFLEKPISTEDLRQAITRALERHPSLEAPALQAVGRRPLREVQDEVRHTMLEQALAITGGSYTEAARLLSISRQAIRQAVRARTKAKGDCVEPDVEPEAGG